MSDAKNQIEKVYRLLRAEEKLLRPIQSSTILNHAEVQAFLKLHLPENSEKKLQEILFHIKDGMSVQQLEYLLIPFERYLQKNLKDDDFIVHTVDAAVPFRKFPLHVALENIRSSFNVGSFFRLCDGLGVEKVHLCGYTPLPSKTSMGADEAVSFFQYPNTIDCLDKLKSENVKLIAVETTNKSAAYDSAYLAGPTCFVFGNERFGLNHDTLRKCDEFRSIPMHGIKNSLNVAVCGGIIISEWVRQHRASGNA